MRGKGISNVFIASRIAYKDGFESHSFDEDEMVVFKKPVKVGVVKPKIASPPKSPNSIFSSFAPVPPAIKLPQSVATAPATKFEVPSLPLTAVWGNARKLVLAKRSQRQALEDIIDEHLDEPLLARARLPTKVNYLETTAQRNIKAMERGLLNKHWIKHHAGKRAARAEHEAHVKEMEAALESTGEAKDQEEAVTPSPANARKPRGHAVKHEKIRRNARRAARDFKCFEFDDSIEVAALDEAPAVFEPKLVPEAAVAGERIVVPHSKYVAELDDIIDAHLLTDRLVSRAHLPIKAQQQGRETAVDRHAKAKQRGLRKKRWIKVRAEKRAARAEHEAHVKEMEAALESTGEAKDQEEAATPSNARKPRGHTVKHEKIRRNARRAARDVKCFDFNDSIEWVPLAPEGAAGGTPPPPHCVSERPPPTLDVDATRTPRR